MAQEVAQQVGPVTIEGARIIFRNFEGREGDYNREGERAFDVVLPPDVAERMQADGWNVKYLKAREEGETPTAHLNVSVSYRKRPPRVVLISYRGFPPEKVRVSLPEDLVGMLDIADLDNVDLIINPYTWGPINGRSGVKAYLKSIYAEIKRDELEIKYENVPEIQLADSPLMLESAHDQLQIEGPDDVIEGEILEEDEEL